LKPARQAQWKDVPVLMHEVEGSQPFLPEIGLQVPHWDHGVGLATTREAVATIKVRMEKCILVDVWA
jgi:hypothetical protein